MSIRATNWAYQQIEKFELNASERLILLALAHKHNSVTGQCTPSGDTIASMCGLIKRSVQKIARKLEKRKLISVKVRSKKGQQQSNQYILLGVSKKAPLKKMPGVSGGTPNKEVTTYPVIDDEVFDFPSQEKMKRGF